MSNINVLFILLEAGKSKMKVSEDSVSDEGLFFIAVTSLCPHMVA